MRTHSSFRWLLSTLCAIPLLSHAQSEVQPEMQAKQLATLKETSRSRVQIDFAGAQVSFASFDVPAARGADPSEAALQFLEAYSSLYRLADPRKHLTESRRVTREGGATIFFDQHYDGVFVDGAQIAVAVQGGRIVSTSGAYLTEPPVLRLPEVTAARAIEIARSSAARHLNDPAMTGEPRLAYFNHTILRNARQIEAIDGDRETHLAWRLTMRDAATAHGLTYFVDAHTGQILEQVTHEQEARDRRVGSTGGSSSGLLLICGYSGEQLWFDETWFITGTVPDTEGWTAWHSAREWYNLMSVRFGRDSFDAHGATMIIHLDVGDFLAPNASARSDCNDVIFSNDMATLDVVSHELTHLLINWTANFKRGGSESGSLHESYSDVFAALVDSTNWTLGEGSARGVMRNMSNPPSQMNPFGVPYPDNMVDFDPQALSGHFNANIMDKAAFLIAAGGTQHNIPVTGLGRTKLGDLYFDVLTGQLPQNATFSMAANVTIARARTFATTGRFGFTNADVCNVHQAFAAVLIVGSDRDCDGIEDGLDPDRDGDTVADVVENCIFVFNPDQLDTDGDGDGDACDDDRDDDGLVNTADNCPTVANPGQGDFNHNGRGDACDDFDSDGVFDIVDNCPYVKNFDQRNTDRQGNPANGDAYGDACDVDLDDDGVCQIHRPTRLDDVGIPPGGCSRVDNCPVKPNPNQSDADGDFIGDACDSCAQADSGRDEDNDGIDSACDTDDDGDGVADVVDNCPVKANADQKDLNNNGVGTVCDPLEKPMMIGGTIVLDKFAAQWREHQQLIEIPLELDESFCQVGANMDIEITADQPVVGGVLDFDTSYDRFAPPNGQSQTVRFTPAFDACLPGNERGALQKAGFISTRAYTLVLGPLDEKFVGRDLTLTSRLVERRSMLPPDPRGR